MPRIPVTLRRVAVILVSVAAIAAGLFLAVRREYYLQQALYHEQCAAARSPYSYLRRQRTDPLWTEGVKRWEKEYRESNTDRARAYRHAARYPWLPEPAEPK